mmetsp:Transcript_33333/g.61192  ORF Transcript_33333/g.61192 Transcript_33333/m.61192 type:complete len:202 (+) Transcript_33333:842-1447(+)
MFVPPHSPLNRDAIIPSWRFDSWYPKTDVFFISGFVGFLNVSFSIKDSISSADKFSDVGAEPPPLIICMPDLIFFFFGIFLAPPLSVREPLLLIAAFKSCDEYIRFLTASLSSSSPNVTNSLFFCIPFSSPSSSISFPFVRGFENMDIPTKPMINVQHAEHAPNLDFTCSSKTNIPQKKEVRTIIDDHVPAATASPAVRMP